jgi:hypothetical protein
MTKVRGIGNLNASSSKKRLRVWKWNSTYPFSSPNSHYSLFFKEFMDDIGKDPKLREKINIYKETRVAHPSISMEEDEVENGPTLEEMLDDLDIEDVEMSEGK